MSLLSAGPEDGAARLELMRLRGHAGDPLGRIRRFGQAGWRLRAEAPVRKTEALAVCLLRMIADGSVAAGERLPGERQLAAAAGISRVSVRSGLGWLGRCGVVEAGTGRVASSGDPALMRLRADFRQTMVDAADMIQPVLPWLAARAARRPVRRLAEAAADPPDRAVREDAFCFALAHAAGSQAAIRLVASLADPLRCIGTVQEAAAARAELVACVEAGQAGSAVAAAERYGAALASAVSTAVEQPRPPEAVLAVAAGLRHARLADRVEGALRHLVSRSDLPAGAQLPGERRLADQLGTSRATVRLALDRLRAAGMVTVCPRRGTRLLRQGGGPGSRDDAASFLDLVELRGLIETWAVRRACRHATGTALSRLRRVTMEINRSNRSDRHRSEDDMAFHYAVSVASGSALHRFSVESMQDLLLDYFDRAQLLVRAGRPAAAEVGNQHAAIARAIGRGEPDLATAAMAEHSRTFEAAFLAARISAR